MRITKKIVATGSSLGVVIDKPICEEMNLKKGDFVELNIKKLPKWKKKTNQ